MSNRFTQIAREIVDELLPQATPAQKGSAMRVIVRKMSNGLTPLTEDVKAFHEKFGLGYSGPPRQLTGDYHDFRQGFMQEELDEYQAAHEAGDLAGQLDALVDLVYVALGTAYLQAFPFGEAWRRVQAANMAKVRVERASDSKRGSTFDVVKPPGWAAPDHSDLVRSEAYDEVHVDGALPF